MGQVVSNQIKIYNILKKRNFDDEEAQLIASAMESKENVVTKEDLAKLDKKMTVLWILTMGAIVITNPRALGLIQRLCGVVK